MRIRIMAANGSPAVTNPRILGKAVRLRAEGKSLQETADALAVHKNTVYRWTQREDVKAAIEAESKRLLQMVPKATDTYERIIDSAKDAEVKPHLIEYPVIDPLTGEIVKDEQGNPRTFLAPATDKIIANNVKLLTLAKDAASDIMVTAGIIPGRAESRVINNFFFAGSGEQLAPLVGALLGQIPDAREPLAIEAEFEECAQDENTEAD